MFIKIIVITNTLHKECFDFKSSHVKRTWTSKPSSFAIFTVMFSFYVLQKVHQYKEPEKKASPR